MDNEMGEIKYVQLEAGAFLADPDFQLMNSAERGIYCSVMFYMYLNDGKILNDPKRIEKLCNADKNFESNWESVQKKFTEKNGFLTHKRVRKELAKAKKFIQRQRKAGLASAAARQQASNDGSTVVQPSFLPSKVKVSKVKERKSKDYTEDFEFFWKNFSGRWSTDKDRYIKVGKYEAFEEWQKLTLTEKRKAASVADKVSGKFTPDACRWLKRKLFDDFAN